MTINVLAHSYVVFPSANLWYPGLLVIQLVLPEELLHHVGHSLHAGDGVALVVEIQQIPGLAAQRKEETDTLGPPGENIQVLKETNSMSKCYKVK